METIIKVPHFQSVKWYHQDITTIIGGNGVGKTLLLKEMMLWCDKKGINYVHYDSTTALGLANELIYESDDDDIILSCRMMAEMSQDFAEDIQRWAKVKTGVTDKDTYMRDVDLLRHVLSLCGNGYTRMFVMTVLAVRNPTGQYYFMDMPETSLHTHLVQVISEYLMHNIRNMKFVMTTHSPDLFGVLTFGDEDENLTVISLPEAYFEPEKSLT